jgi:hypothetical protein
MDSQEAFSAKKSATKKKEEIRLGESTRLTDHDLLNVMEEHNITSEAGLRLWATGAGSVFHRAIDDHRSWRRVLLCGRTLFRPQPLETSFLLQTIAILFSPQTVAKIVRKNSNPPQEEASFPAKIQGGSSCKFSKVDFLSPRKIQP